MQQIMRNARIVSQLAAHLIKGRLREPRPFFLSHLVTSRCNFTCQGCLWKDNSGESLTLDQIRSLYVQAKASGFIANYVWGGEPLIRKDIGEILRASKETGMLTLINTNGWFVAERLAEIGPQLDVLFLSLDHSTAEGHDRIRGQEGSYERIVESIALLKTHYPQIRLILNSIVLKENEDDLDNILKVWQELGVSGYLNFIEMDLLTSSGLGQQNIAVDIAEKKRQQLARQLIARKKEGFPLLNTYNYFEKFTEGKKSYRCHFPKIFLEVYPDGSILDCVRVDKPVGNVRDTPLKELLERPRIKGMIDDGQKWCHVHNNADRIDASNTWELHRESLLTGTRFFLRGR